MPLLFFIFVYIVLLWPNHESCVTEHTSERLSYSKHKFSNADSAVLPEVDATNEDVLLLAQLLVFD